MKERWQGFCRFMGGLHPVRFVALGYVSYVLFGWVLLSLPISHGAGAVSALDALFTSTSAVSTAGLTTVSTGRDFNGFGQLMILLLIQIGGLGYMTFGSFVVLSRSESLSRRRQQIGKIVFSMPEEFRIDKFIRSVIVFTIAIEAAGALALFFIFRRAGVDSPLWSSVFHSVSAFCTAGFGLYDDSIETLRGNVAANVVLGILSYIGAIGFIVLVDGWRRIIGKTPRLTLTSRVILVTTAWVSLAAAALFYVGEPTIQSLPPYERATAAAFQVMSSITTVGFNTIGTGALAKASVLLVIVMMVIPIPSWTLDVGEMPAGTLAILDAFREEIAAVPASDVYTLSRLGVRLTPAVREEFEKRLAILVEEMHAADDPAGEPYGLLVGLHRRRDEPPGS